MSYHNSTKHYKIDKRKIAGGEVFAIEEGPTFENLMDVSVYCQQLKTLCHDSMLLVTACYGPGSYRICFLARGTKALETTL